MIRRKPIPKTAVAIGSVKPGSIVRNWRGATYVVLHSNSCRVHVLVDEGKTSVTAGDRTFQATRRRMTDVAPDATVTVIGFDVATLAKHDIVVLKNV